MNDHELARDIAKKASHLVLDIRAEFGVDYSSRESTKALADLADTSANELLISALQTHRPNDAILSESAIHVALWDNVNSVFLAGAIALIDHDFVWNMDIAGPSVKRDARGQAFIVIASPRENKVLLENFMRELESRVTEFGFKGVELDHCGSVGGKTYRVLSGQAEVYVSSAGFNEWDSAAPAAVGLAQGLCVSDMEGNDLRFNQMPPITPSFVATWPEYHGMVIQSLQNRHSWT